MRIRSAKDMEKLLQQARELFCTSCALAKGSAECRKCSLFHSMKYKARGGIGRDFRRP